MTVVRTAWVRFIKTPHMQTHHNIIIIIRVSYWKFGILYVHLHCFRVVKALQIQMTLGLIFSIVEYPLITEYDSSNHLNDNKFAS